MVNSLAAVHAAQKAHPELRIDETGDASITKATLDKSNEEMGKSMFMSLGLTLIILMFTFGALVAAGIPVLLGLTAVLATLGLLGPVSQLAPVDASVMHVVLLVGMAVGVDYSLFYVKRAREERAAGRETDAAIEAAAATSGRAVVISGFTVMVAMAGMYLGGISNFASFATGTIMVVAVAVLGSLTVLPAVLSKLGNKVERGRRAVPRPASEPRRRGHLVPHRRQGPAPSAALGHRGRRRPRGADGSGARNADVPWWHRRHVA